MQNNNFKDLFSEHSASYSQHRPHSPSSLFAFLVSEVHSTELAWDVGTGNGQAAIDLVEFFDKVIATDASEQQISQTTKHPKIEYRVSRAEEPCLSPNSANLITVAQALHWFDFDKFYNEVNRVSANGAVLAAWSYQLAKITPKIDDLVTEWYDGALRKYWPPERKLVDDGYKSIPFPYQEIPTPNFTMVEERNFDQWCGYLRTWSATQRAMKDKGEQYFDDFVLRLRAAWGPPMKTREIHWPLAVRVGRV